MTLDLSFAERLDPKWQMLFGYYEDELRDIATLLDRAVDNGSSILPDPPDVIFRAFELTPFDEVKVLVVGQDPYPARQYAMGLAFSVPPSAALPLSLRNLFTEYHDDLGYPAPSTGDLTPWASQGMLLLNRTLTVREGSPGSHAGIGWETLTEGVVRQLALRPGKPLVAILLGAQAHDLAPVLHAGGVPTLRIAHPSPRSARRGFFGSKPFSRANRQLERLGAVPVDWRLP